MKAKEKMEIGTLLQCPVGTFKLVETSYWGNNTFKVVHGRGEFFKAGQGRCLPAEDLDYLVPMGFNKVQRQKRKGKFFFFKEI